MARYSAAFPADDDVAPAIATFEASLALMHEVGDEWGAAFVAGWIARCLVAQGKDTEALAAAQENVTTHQRLGDMWGTGMAIGMLGQSEPAGGRPGCSARLRRAGPELAHPGWTSSQSGRRLGAAGRYRRGRERPGGGRLRLSRGDCLLEGLGNRPYATNCEAGWPRCRAKQDPANSLHPFSPGLLSDS